MTIHQSAYHTTACREFSMKKTTDALVAAQKTGWLSPVNQEATEGSAPVSVNLCVLSLQGGSSFADAVPAFAHPLHLPKGDDKDRQLIALDVRGFGRWDAQQAQFRVRNAPDYNVAVSRGALDYIWATSAPTILREIHNLPMSVYASWLSESISRRFSLEPQEQFRLLLLSAIFYYSLFVPSTQECTDNEKARAASQISRNLRCSAEDVLSMMDETGFVGSLSEYCVGAQKATQSIRLAELSPGVVMTIVGMSWFGANSRELTAVALEHPPTWLAIILASTVERSFKHSAIARLIERLDRKSEHNAAQAIIGLIRNHSKA